MAKAFYFVPIQQIISPLFLLQFLVGRGAGCKAPISDSFYCPLQLHVPIKFHCLCGCCGLTITEWRLKSYQSYKFITYMTHIPHPTETPFYCVGWVRCIDIEKPQYLWLDESWTIIVQGNKYILIHVYISTQWTNAAGHWQLSTHTQWTNNQ